MTSLFRIGIQIGATLAGGFASTFQGARATLAGLSTATDVLRARHERLGDIMARSMAHPMRNIAALREQYARLGATLQTLELRHNQLTASLARGEALREDRSRMGGEIMATVATAAAVALPVAGAIKHAAKFELDLRDIAITGKMSNVEENKLGLEIRNAALTTNQPHAAIISGVNTMVQQGMDAKKAGGFAALLGQAATATNAAVIDLGKLMFSLENTLQIKGSANLKEALNRAAFGASAGAFEMREMAAYIPEFAAQYAARGIFGQEAVTQIIASLQVARMTTGSAGEAATNKRGWLSHMNSKHTIDAYAKAGVDYQASMQAHVAAGITQVEASLMIANKFIDTRGEEFMKKWTALGSKGDQAGQKTLMESFGIAEIFADIQNVNYLLGQRQYAEKYKEIKGGMGSAKAKTAIDVDSARRMATSTKGWERLKTSTGDLAITIGTTLLPALNACLDNLVPILKSLAAFSAAHPGVIKGVVMFAGGVVGLKLAFLAAGWALNFFLLSPLNLLRTGIITIMARWTMLRAIFMMGGARFPFLLQILGLSKLGPMLARLGLWLRGLGGVLLAVGRALLPFGQGLLMAVFGPIKLLGQGVMWLGKLLLGSLAAGLRLAGQAVLFLGRALLMNPIGLIITAIAVGAYLIYRNWDKIAPFFARMWASIKSVTIAGWNGLKSMFFSYNPLGILIKNWQPITTWFTSMAAKFRKFGGDIINGLSDGLASFASKPLEKITAMGAAMRDQFKAVLGIRSPSRVFGTLGYAIAEGASVGINAGRGLAVGAVAGMALASTAAWAMPKLGINSPTLPRLQANTPNNALAALGDPSRNGPEWLSQVKPLQNVLQEKDRAAGGGITISFAPSINVTIAAGDPAGVKEQIGQAMQQSYQEFERMMQRYQRDQARNNYNGRP
jgi:Phage-related minor tail protein